MDSVFAKIFRILNFSKSKSMPLSFMLQMRILLLMYVLSALDFYDLYSFVVFFMVLIINALKKGSEYL